MKKIFFLLTMLASVAASAQSGITVTPVSANSSAVTFNVSWLNSSRTGTHNSKVWVFVDYRPVMNNVPSGSWERALIAGTPTVTSGAPSRETGNDKGFWLQGTSGSSGTYNATVTVTLSNVPAKYNWCAYVSDYPPNVTANSGTYTFKGTPPFILIASNGATQPVTGTTLTTSALTITPTTIMDATACPGVFCPYQGSDLYIDATHLCQQRTSGAKNWEAWIKDARDNEYYRIVFMPDNKWWLAQNLKYAPNGQLKSGCDKDSCGRFYKQSDVYGGNYAVNQQKNCPAGWVLPSVAQWTALTTSISSTLTVAWRDMRSLQTPCSPKTDRFGWAAKGRSANDVEPNDGCGWHAANTSNGLFALMDNGTGSNAICDSTADWLTYVANDTFPYPIRCLRL
jgi:uncharacterized protein (TIGR02145 family)